MADKTSETDTDRWFHHFKMSFLGSIVKWMQRKHYFKE